MEAVSEVSAAPAVVRMPALERAMRLRKRLPHWAPALAFYTVVALITVGGRLLGHLGSACACQAAADPSGSMWGLAWWPHALLHGLNPFSSDVVWTPVGANLAKAPLIPTAALALAPVTELFGPLVSYNLLTIAAPILASFTAYLLCRRIVGRELPAIVGGYIFGFSTYMYAQLTAHANLFLVFLVPVMVHLALRRAEGDLSRRRYVVWMAIVMVAQIGLSSEVLATSVMVGALALLAAAALAPRALRRRVLVLTADTALAGALAAVVVSPYLYYALVKGGPPLTSPGADLYGTDLFNPFVPTLVSWIHGDAVFEGGHWPEVDGYLSLPLLAAFVLWADRERARFLTRLLAGAFVTILFLSLGSHLAVNGYEQLASLWPYNLVKGWPVIQDIEPGRLMIYAALVLGVAIADWLAAADRRTHDRRRALRLRWSVVLLGLVLLLPDFTSDQWFAKPDNPPFFTTTAYRHSLTRGESVLVLPYWQNDFGSLWQAETGFYFKMPGGYLLDYTPPQFAAIPATNKLESITPVTPPELSRFLHVFRVRHVVELPGDPYAATLAALHLPERTVAGVQLYTVTS